MPEKNCNMHHKNYFRESNLSKRKKVTRQVKSIKKDYFAKEIPIYVITFVVSGLILIKLYTFYSDMLAVQEELFQQKVLVSQLANTLEGTLKELAEQIKANKDLITSQLKANKELLGEQSQHNRTILQSIKTRSMLPTTSQSDALTKSLANLFLPIIMGALVTYTLQIISSAVLKQMTDMVHLSNYLPAWFGHWTDHNQIVEFQYNLLETPVVGRMTFMNDVLLEFVVKKKGAEHFVDVSTFVHQAACNLSVTETEVVHALSLFPTF